MHVKTLPGDDPSFGSRVRLPHSVARANLIIALRAGPLGFSELRDKSGLASTTFHRNLTDLVSDGTVLRVAKGGYRLSRAGLSLAKTLEGQPVVKSRRRSPSPRAPRESFLPQALADELRSSVSRSSPEVNQERACLAKVLSAMMPAKNRRLLLEMFELLS